MTSQETIVHIRSLGSTRLVQGVALTVIGLALIGLLMWALGIDPIAAYWSILRGALGSRVNLSDTIAKTVPIALIGFGVALTFRCGLWNIGGEGQLYFGAAAALVVGVELDGPAYVVLPAVLLAGVTAGALTGLIPAVLRIYLSASEILVTLMLNFIALLFAGFLISGPYKDPVVPATVPVGEAARLPNWSIGGLRISPGVLALLGIALFLSFMMRHSTYGFRIRMTGINAEAALNAGLRVSRVRLSAFLIAGALAGLAGAVQLTGISRSLVDGFSPGFGYSAIVAALLGQLRMIPTLIASFGLSALLVGAQAMQRAQGIEMTLVSVIQGSLLLLLLGAGVIGRGLIGRKAG